MSDAGGSGMVPGVRDEGVHDRVERVLGELIRPLIEADGGDVTLTSIDANKSPLEIVLTVGGSYRGCPGTPFVSRGVIEPALSKALATQVRVRVVPRIS